jgi:transcriptional regulator with XRE-family HTH domain
MDLPSVHDLVDRLFATYRKQNGEEYSIREVAREIQKQGFGEISAGYLAKLRRGEASNPSRDVLLQLCLFFGVPASYFFPELDKQVPRLPASGDPVVQVRTVFRSVGLPDKEREQLEGLFEMLYQRTKERS